MEQERTHPCERCGNATRESELEHVTTHSGGEDHEWWLCSGCRRKSDAAKRAWVTRKRALATRGQVLAIPHSPED